MISTPPSNDHPIDQALAALPSPAPDVASAERIRLRARAELGRAARHGAVLGRAWDRGEPYVAAAVVLAFLGWTAVKIAAVLS